MDALLDLYVAATRAAMQYGQVNEHAEYYITLQQLETLIKLIREEY